MSAKIIYLIFGAAGLMAVAAGITSWRRSRMDGLILVSGGLFGLMQVLTLSQLPRLIRGGGAWHLWAFADTRTVYVIGLFFLICFFCTKIRGWQRAAYLVGGIVGLSPIIVIAMIGLAFMTNGSIK